MNAESPFEQAALYVSGALPTPEEKALTTPPMNAELEFEIDALSEIFSEQILLLPRQDAPLALRQQLVERIAKLPQKARFAPIIVPSPEAMKKPVELPKPRAASGWALPIAAAFVALAGWGLWERSQENHRLAMVQADFSKEKLALANSAKEAMARAALLQAENARYQQELEKKSLELAALSPQVSTLQKSLADSQAEIKHLTEQNDISKLQLVALASKLTPKASAVVVWDHEHNKGVLRVNGLDVQKPNQDYQLWMISPDSPTPVSAGVFKVESDGTARLVFSPSGPITGTRTFAVSLEKEGGVPAPKGKVVLQGGL